MKYPNKESAILEFKRSASNNKQAIIKTVIGYANTYGGQIIIGVEDNQEITGINEQEAQQLYDDLTRSIYDSITPSLFPSIHTKRLGDKLVMIIDIAEGASKPYHLSRKQQNESTYVRLGAHTMLASADIIHQLQWQGKRKFLDEMPVYEANRDDIDIHFFEKFLAQRRQKNTGVDTNEMLLHYGILVKDRGKIYPSVAGSLLF